MSAYIRYIGTQTFWKEFAITGRNCQWQPDMQDECPDGVVAALMATGLFRQVAAKDVGLGSVDGALVVVPKTPAGVSAEGNVVVARGPKFRNLLEFVSGGYNALADHTTAIQAAQTAATAEGFDIEVPPLAFNYEAIINGGARSWRGAGRGLSRIVCQTTDGDNSRWHFTGASGLTISGITFEVPNKPVGASNNATETACILRITSSTDVRVMDCDFLDPYGVPVLFRGITGGLMQNLRSIGGYKDSFHITGTSKYITRLNCEVIDGGDDGFAVVGYKSGSTIGQPEYIRDIACRVLGVKYARAFAYVGSKNVRSWGCYVKGLIPADRPQDPAYRTLAGLLIARDASVDTYGNEDVRIEGMTMEDCGGTGYASVCVLASADGPSKDIYVQARVRRSALRHVYATGGAAAALENVVFDVDCYDNTDPNGHYTTAGNGSSSAVEVDQAKNVKIRGRIEEAGGYGVWLGTSVSGIVDVDVTTKNINKNGAAGRDIIFVGSGTLASELHMQLNIEAQPQINSAGTPYFIDRIIECQSATTAIRKMRVLSLTNLNKAILTSRSETSVSLGASPAQFDNPAPFPILVRVDGGTGVTVRRGVSGGGLTPTFAIVSSVKAAGYFELLAGESLQITYTTAPTVTWRPTIE